MSGRLRVAGKRLLRRTFEVGQRLGVDILPRHFYSSVPDIQTLRRSRQWRAPYTMVGVPGANLNDQLSFVHSCCERSVVDRLGDGTAVYRDACHENGAIGYGPAEAMFLYCFVSTQMPAKVIQIGAGVATSVILRAARETGYTPVLECVDPYPTAMLEAKATAGDIRLIARPAQAVDVQALTDLSAGDLLFIDSTHTVKPASEVGRLILEVMPRLQPGVVVHFHDVLFPYDYSPTILGDDLFFWTETILLHAFLAGNSAWQLLASLSMIHHAASAQLRAVLPAYRPAQFTDGLIVPSAEETHFPSAAYMQRVV